jgi:hypothetical protein
LVGPLSGPSGIEAEEANRVTHSDANQKDPDLPPLSKLLLDVGVDLYGCLSEIVAFGLDEKHQRPLDTDDPEYVRQIPEHDRLRYLRMLSWQLFDDRESADGLRQTPLDRLAHAHMAKVLAARVPGSVVLGEESSKEDWDKAADLPHGTFVWILDPIDGSGLQDTVGFGYSVNVILYRTHAKRPARPLMSLIVTGTSLMLGWISGGTVGAAYLNYSDPETGRPRIAEITGPLADIELVKRERRQWISVVAAQPRQRRLVEALLNRDSSWAVMTLGGAPAMPGLLIDMLAALVVPTPQSRHDAAPLLALASGQGLSFVDIATGVVYTDAQVRSFFNGIERPGTAAKPNPGYKPIPAMVIAREASAAVELATLLRNHWETLRAESTRTDQGGSQARIISIIREASDEESP